LVEEFVEKVEIPREFELVNILTDLTVVDEQLIKAKVLPELATLIGTGRVVDTWCSLEVDLESWLSILGSVHDHFIDTLHQFGAIDDPMTPRTALSITGSLIETRQKWSRVQASIVTVVL
jgi:hypothetical protein